MKKILTISFLLIASVTFAQTKTVIKVQGQPGIYGLANNTTGDSLIFYSQGIRHAIPVTSNVDLSNYYDKTQVDNSLNGKLAISDTAAMLLPYVTELGKKRDTSYYQSITAIKPLHWNIITPDSATINLYIDTTSTLSDHSDTTATTSKAVKNYVDNQIAGKMNYTDSSSMLSPYLRKIDTTGKWISPAVANATYATISNLALKAGLGTNTFTGAQTINDGLGVTTVSGAGVTFNRSQAYFQNLYPGGITTFQQDNVYFKSKDGSTIYFYIAPAYMNINSTTRFKGVIDGTGNFATLDATTGELKYRTPAESINDLGILGRSDTLKQQRLPYQKKWVIFGDSFSSQGYHYYTDVNSMLGLTGTVSFGVSGATIKKQSLVLDSIIAATPAYFTNFNIASVLIGVNDFALSRQIGTRKDLDTDTTYAGYLKHFIETILTSNPNIELYIMTPPEGNSVAVPYKGTNSAGWTLKDLSVLIAQICSDYAVNCIDLYNLSQFNLYTIPTYTADGLHPINQGSKVLAQIISNAFINRNSKGQVIDARKVEYLTGTSAPTSTPSFIGQEFLDLTNKKYYKAFGTTSSSDWIIQN